MTNEKILKALLSFPYKTNKTKLERNFSYKNKQLSWHMEFCFINQTRTKLTFPMLTMQKFFIIKIVALLDFQSEMHVRCKWIKDFYHKVINEPEWLS